MPPILSLPIVLLLALPSGDSAQRFQGEWSTLTGFLKYPVVNQSGPSLAVDLRGVRHVVYTGYGTCGSDLCGVFYQFSADGKYWSQAFLIPGSESVAMYSYPAIVADLAGRVVIAWFGSQGLELTWTDDRGHGFAPVLLPAPGAPGGSTSVDMVVDPAGALHFAWESSNDLYYLRTLPLADPFEPTRSSSVPSQRSYYQAPPVFLPVQQLFAEDGKVYHSGVRVGVDQLDNVTIVYEGIGDAQIWVTRAAHGIGFGPAVSIGVGDAVQLSVAPEGPVTVIFNADYLFKQRVLSLVSLDGTPPFLGPFLQTEGKGGTWQRHSTHVREGGTIAACWVESWQGMGSGSHLTYRESRDYGVSFPVRELVHDNRDYPGANDPNVSLAPDGSICVVVQACCYTEGR